MPLHSGPVVAVPDLKFYSDLLDADIDPALVECVIDCRYCGYAHQTP
jgi:sulfatase maturation enzyme AslB (radical SAM superfamily)